MMKKGEREGGIEEKNDGGREERTDGRKFRLRWLGRGKRGGKMER